MQRDQAGTSNINDCKPPRQSESVDRHAPQFAILHRSHVRPLLGTLSDLFRRLSPRFVKQIPFRSSLQHQLLSRISQIWLSVDSKSTIGSATRHRIQSYQSNFLADQSSHTCVCKLGSPVISSNFLCCPVSISSQCDPVRNCTRMRLKCRWWRHLIRGSQL